MVNTNLQESPCRCGHRHINGIATRTNCARYREDDTKSVSNNPSASSVPKRGTALTTVTDRTWVHNWFDERMTPPNNAEPIGTPHRLLVDQAMTRLIDSYDSVARRMLRPGNRRLNARDQDYARYVYMSKYGIEFLRGNPTREQIAERARLEEEFYAQHKGKRTKAGLKVVGTGATRSAIGDLNAHLNRLDRHLADKRIKGPTLGSAQEFRDRANQPGRQFVVQPIDAASMESPFARYIGDDVAIRPSRGGGHTLAASMSASPSRMPEIEDSDLSDASEDGFTLFAGTPRETRLVYSPQPWVE